jgi:hypothetical protein
MLAAKGASMGLLDKAKKLLGDHEQQVEQGIDKAADIVDDKTGGKYTEKIDDAADKAKSAVEKLDD